MHYVTTNPKVKRTNLEERLLTVGQELARKNYRLGMIESYLDEVLAEWKSTRDKYRNTKTRVSRITSLPSREKLQCLNDDDQLVFTIE